MVNTLISFIRIPFLRIPSLHRKIFALTGFRPGNIELYRCALTHKSVSNYSSYGQRINNERLEYLGDALLGAIIADYLFNVYHDSNEGFLTKMRAKLVNRDNLNQVAKKMGFDKLIILHNNAVPTKKNLYGNALEAIIGAIYIDKGFNKSKKFIIDKIIRTHFDLDQLEYEDRDFKSQIIQWGQKNKQVISFVSHETIEEVNNQPLFVSTIHIMDMPAGEGIGATKKEAQQHAARQALKNLPS